MNDKPLGIAVIGAGTIAGLHVDAIKRAGHRLVAVCDPRMQAAQRLAGPAGAGVFSDHHAVLADSAVDAVIITVPHALHAPIALEALAAGKHVLIEKPIAVTHEEGAAIVEAATATGLTVAVGHVLRFVPALAETARLVESGQIGAPRLMVERRASDYSAGSRPDWFFDPAVAGGGIVLNVGTHAIDRVQILGGAPVVSVHAHVTSRPGSAVETESAALLELANGVRATIALSGTGLPFTEELSVVGERGALTISRDEGVHVYQDGKLVRTVRNGAQDMADAFLAQLQDFAAAVREGRPPRVDARYGLDVLDVALAFYASSARGGVVQVGPTGVRVAA